MFKKTYICALRSKAFSILALCLAISGTVLSQEQIGSERSAGAVVLEEIRFYASDKQNVDDIKTYEKRYRSSFGRRSLRYIFVETSIRNQLFESSPQRVTKRVDLIRPDGTTKKYTWRSVVPRNADTFLLTGGIGFSTPGLWMRGEYKAIVFLNGKRVGEKTFVVLENESGDHVTATGLAATGYPLGLSRTFPASTSLTKSTARNVYLNLRLKNNLFNVKDQSVSVQWTVWFKGRQIYRNNSTERLPKNRSEIFWHWPIKRTDGGRFSSGVYRIICRINGRAYETRLTINK